jgi:hypothetical protein
VGILKRQKARKALDGLESRLGEELPPEFHAVVSGGEGLELGVCRISDADTIAGLIGRAPCWPAELIPFGSASANSFCLMKQAGKPAEDWPVVLAISDPPAVLPLSSGFRSFLFFLAIRFRDSASLGKEGERAKKLLADQGVPADLMETPVPPPKLPEETYKYDREALLARCVLALRSGEIQSMAKGLLALAKEAPWWGAPHYLLAKLYQRQSHVPNTCGCYWNGLERPDCFSGTTTRPDLGDLGISRRIGTDAVAFLKEHAAQVPAQLKRHPRWQWMMETPDPMSPKPRLELARSAAQNGDPERALWRYLDVLAVGWRDSAVLQEALPDMADIYRGLGRTYEATVCQAG